MACACQRSQQDRTIAPDDERETAFPMGFANRVHESKVESTHGMAVAQTRSRLGLGGIDRPRQFENVVRADRVKQSSSYQCRGATPCTGFMLWS